ncbi:hypothetical protein JOF39_003335 [Glutamicibacter protophormiae]|uniref:Uncharacterized protein n=1 Tax=Glutamicibacter protophormiae TaxID=37930 RepID=A0ABS4XUR3_GLUPR|nr:hypothetical protein [Glutamicibacter protophormiae]
MSLLMVTKVSSGPASDRAWLKVFHGAAGFLPTPVAT